MTVVRIDLYDFKVILDVKQLNNLIMNAEDVDCEVDDVLHRIIVMGFDEFYNIDELKET